MLMLLALGATLVDLAPHAIAEAVRARMGEVRVAIVELRIPNPESRIPDATLVAAPEPSSRLGRAMRFVLSSGGGRVGSVVATLHVTGSAVRATRAIARGEAVPAEALEAADVELSGMLLRRLPSLEEVAGSQARRDIAAGEVLTDALVIAPPAVRSGDEVSVSVTAGRVEVVGVGRASGSGRTGDVIRVVLPSSRTPRTARITGPGSVEIVR
jgi:flagella basal body P-ring formation protein FlgA